jgi:hypothetical protein
MGLRTWSRSEAEFGRKVLNSAFEGARSGREEFLDGRSVREFVSGSIQRSFEPAAVGLCIGVLGSCPGNRRKSIGRAVVFALLGGAVGFGASVAWESRRLTASAAAGASRNINRVCDERWMKKHSIAYA